MIHPAAAAAAVAAAVAAAAAAAVAAAAAGRRCRCVRLLRIAHFREGRGAEARDFDHLVE